MVTITSALQLTMQNGQFLNLPSDPYNDETPVTITDTQITATSPDGVVTMNFFGSFNSSQFDPNGHDDSGLINFISGYSEFVTENSDQTFTITDLPNLSRQGFDNLQFPSIFSGSDSITSFATNDMIQGYGGNDTINAGSGNDTILGGSDYFDFSDGSDEIYGGSGDDTVFASSGDDTIYGGVALVDSTDGSDVIFAGAGSDAVYGNAGDDVIIGAQGNDSLFGGLGNDTYVLDRDCDVDTIFFEGAGQEGGDRIFIDSSLASNAAQVLNSIAGDDGTHIYLDFGQGDGALVLFGSGLTEGDLLFA